MSPTSYQAAPPRTTTIDDVRNAVKSPLEKRGAARPAVAKQVNFVDNFNLSCGAFLLIGLIDFPAPFCYFLGAGEVHSG